MVRDLFKIQENVPLKAQVQKVNAIKRHSPNQPYSSPGGAEKVSPVRAVGVRGHAHASG